jgi:predicted metal-dependent enzyme (double-stranded beta helix superfamily)
VLGGDGRALRTRSRRSVSSVSTTARARASRSCASSPAARSAPGSTSYLLPPYQEIHAIGNNTDRTTVSVHVYGRDIDEVNVFDPIVRTVRPMRIKYYNPDCGGPDFAI